MLLWQDDVEPQALRRRGCPVSAIRPAVLLRARCSVSTTESLIYPRNPICRSTGAHCSTERE